MTKTPIVLAAAAAFGVAALAAPAEANGRRVWRGSGVAGGWAIGAISANVITPDYFPYHGYSYSYNGRNYYPGPISCWRWRHGYRFWIC